MIGLLLSLACANTVEGASMQLEWTVKEGVLRGVAHSTGPGWLAVGFNDHPGLDGTVLLMASHHAGQSLVEEHVAQPPSHPPRSKLGTPGLLSSSIRPEPKGFVFEFTWRLHTGDGLQVDLKSGAPAWITLAWSQDPAFDHHSSQRVQRKVIL